MIEGVDQRVTGENTVPSHSKGRQGFMRVQCCTSGKQPLFVSRVIQAEPSLELKDLNAEKKWVLYNLQIDFFLFLLHSHDIFLHFFLPCFSILLLLTSFR